jgi:hypothetical protein
MTIISGLMMTGCPTDDVGSGDVTWVLREHTVTLTFPNPDWPNVTKDTATRDEWRILNNGVKIEILEENVKEVDWDYFYEHWTGDNNQYSINCGIGLYNFVDQKIVISYYDLAYKWAYDERFNPAPFPLGTPENPVVFDLKVSYKIKY